MTNEQLMELAIKDDMEAFRRLYENLRQKLYNYIRASVGNEEIAIELVQDTFLKAFKNRKMYRVEYKVSTWIWSIARNGIIDFMRKKDPLKHKNFIEDGDIVETIKDDELLLDEKIDQSLRKEKVLEALVGIPERQKDALLLRVQGEYSYSEIAEIMNTSESSVKALIFKGKKKLIELLGKEI